ncbi:MAG TPA: hypothetical protein VNH11_22720 [Pirellulales bacterium]|nr:hypothetical protein [Pirellulales bacterium]
MLQSRLRTLAAEWARANAPIVEADLLSSFDHAVQRGVNCTFAIGRELTKARKPRLLSCYSGELFVFELSQRQAQSFNALDHTMECVECGPSLEIPPGARPPIDIGELHIDHADRLSPDQPIQGRVEYELREEFDFSGTVCLSMAFALGDRCLTTRYHYPFPPLRLSPKGNMDFTFNSVATSQGAAKDWSGPIVAHVRLLGTMHPQSPDGRVPMSNTCALLLDVL